MFVVLGILTVCAAVVGGYLLEHGNLHVLYQPAELVIIFGAAAGSFCISAPPRVIRLVLRNAGTLFKPAILDRRGYTDLLLLLGLIFRRIRSEGLLAVENDINDPAKSSLFAAYPRLLALPLAMEFLCASLRVFITSNVAGHELEALLDLDIESSAEELNLPGIMVGKVADALPGLGIVAAVLGVVITMGKISEPPEVLGHSIGAALVGTFLGVLACYGFVGPIAANLEIKAREEETVLIVIKTALVSMAGGAVPQMAVESARRAIPGANRPSYNELDEAFRQAKAGRGDTPS
jgi:chemotaxis protein MotA